MNNTAKFERHFCPLFIFASTWTAHCFEVSGGYTARVPFLDRKLSVYHVRLNNSDRPGLSHFVSNKPALLFAGTLSSRWEQCWNKNEAKLFVPSVGSMQQREGIHKQERIWPHSEIFIRPNVCAYHRSPSSLIFAWSYQVLGKVCGGNYLDSYYCFGGIQLGYCCQTKKGYPTTRFPVLVAKSFSGEKNGASSHQLHRIFRNHGQKAIASGSVATQNIVVHSWTDITPHYWQVTILNSPRFFREVIKKFISGWEIVDLFQSIGNFTTPHHQQWAKVLQNRVVILFDRNECQHLCEASWPAFLYGAADSLVVPPGSFQFFANPGSLQEAGTFTNRLPQKCFDVA